MQCLTLTVRGPSQQLLFRDRQGVVLGNFKCNRARIRGIRRPVIVRDIKGNNLTALINPVTDRQCKGMKRVRLIVDPSFINQEPSSKGLTTEQINR